MKVFLTGGTGFIGSYVLLDLVMRGHEVTVLARNENKVPGLKELDGVRIVQGTLADFDLIEDLLQGQDHCIHVALNYTKQTGREVLEDDTLPTVFMADAAARAGVKGFIYTSSTAANDSVYRADTNLDPEMRKGVKASMAPTPTTFYGATKAASECYLKAQSYQSPMRVNIIRPGYTFGNPAIESGSMYSDRRFFDIAENAVAGRPIVQTKHDGTQFIWAGDLSKIYMAVMDGDVNRKTYFGLSRGFVSWEWIARKAVELAGSSSPIEIEDKGWSADPTLFDVSEAESDFGLAFDAEDALADHVAYLVQRARGTIQAERA